MASLEVMEADQVRHYVVWRVPLPVGGPANTVAPVNRRTVQIGESISGGLENVAYLVVKDDPEDSHGGEVLWYRTTYIGESQKGVPGPPAPFVNESLSWNPQKKRLYLVETTWLCCHAMVEVYEIDPSTTYGTYPPVVFRTASQKSGQSSRSSNPIVFFDPEEPGDAFLDVEYVQALAEPNRLLISIRIMRGISQFASHFIVDLDSKSWKRESLK